MSPGERASLWLNVRTGGDPGELFCARVHKRGWIVLEMPINAVFLVIRWETRHCRRCAELRYD